jgi:Zn-dependent M16 (insulinase) family peptidase
MQVALSLSAHALDRNVPAMFELLGEVVAGARWAGESERLGLLLTRRAASAGAQLGPSGLTYAKGAAAASIQVTQPSICLITLTVLSTYQHPQHIRRVCRNFITKLSC